MFEKMLAQILSQMAGQIDMTKLQETGQRFEETLKYVVNTAYEMNERQKRMEVLLENIAINTAPKVALLESLAKNGGCENASGI